MLKEISNTMIKNGFVNVEKIITIKSSNNLSKDFYVYAKNFKEAAWKVANEMVEDKSNYTLDTMFFCLTFLYRHSIELILKAIAFKNIVNPEQRKAFLTDTTHNFELILAEIEPFINESILQDTECYNWLKCLLKSMTDFDKESDSFRYPFSIIKFDSESKTFHAKWIFEKQTHIDLVKLVNKMEIAFQIIDTYYSKNKIESKLYKEYTPLFLEEGGNYYQQSVVGFEYNRSEMYLYVKAYEDAAKLLYNEIIKRPEQMDTYFFPLCYSYRNALELSLKAIILSLYTLNESLEKISKRKHSIFKLWKCVEQEILERTSTSVDNPKIKEIKSLIQEIHDFDPLSDKFRYPIGKDLNYHFKDQQKYDIERFNKLFDSLLSFLDNISYMISEQNQNLAELTMEMRSWSDY
jgi:hypothetical protein